MEADRAAVEALRVQPPFPAVAAALFEINLLRTAEQLGKSGEVANVTVEVDVAFDISLGNFAETRPDKGLERARTAHRELYTRRFSRIDGFAIPEFNPDRDAQQVETLLEIVQRGIFQHLHRRPPRRQGK